MNQSQYRIQYDANNCGGSNITYYNYTLVGPSYANTSWNSWSSFYCSGNYYNQTRNLTQYDTYYCASNTTYYEYNATAPIYANTSWGVLTNTSGCQTNDTINQKRNLTQYDTHYCASNTTYYNYSYTS